MDKFIITVSREFGCGARDIARGLASELLVPFHDRDLVEMTVKKAGISQKDASGFFDEDCMPGNQRSLWSVFGYGSSDAFFTDKAIEAQKQCIREIAERPESCIIFGRCADYILREHHNVLRFFLYTPVEKRIAHIAESYGLTEKEAAKMVKRIDKQRHNYYKYVTGHNRGDRIDKSVMIDVSCFGSQGTIELMLQALRVFQGRD